MKVYSLSHIRLFETPSTVAHQAPLSMEFFRQEYWSGLPFPFPGDILDPGIEPGSPALQADSSPFGPPGKLSSVGEADPMARGRHGWSSLKTPDTAMVSSDWLGVQA